MKMTYQTLNVKIPAYLREYYRAINQVVLCNVDSRLIDSLTFNLFLTVQPEVQAVDLTEIPADLMKNYRVNLTSAVVADLQKLADERHMALTDLVISVLTWYCAIYINKV